MQAEKKYELSEVSLLPPILTVVVFPDAGRYIAKCIELDLITEMDTKEEALHAIVEMMKEYADDYL